MGRGSETQLKVGEIQSIRGFAFEVSTTLDYATPIFTFLIWVIATGLEVDELQIYNAKYMYV